MKNRVEMVRPADDAEQAGKRVANVCAALLLAACGQLVSIDPAGAASFAPDAADTLAAVVSSQGLTYWAREEAAKRSAAEKARKAPDAAAAQELQAPGSPTAGAAPGPRRNLRGNPRTPSPGLTSLAGGPANLARIATIESANNPGAVNPSTGAVGAYQFTAPTAARYGGNGTVAAAHLMADNADALAIALGRDPTPSELYLAHQQGAAGAVALLQNPDSRAVDVLMPFYKSPDIAARAITGNGGTADMTAGDFTKMWDQRFCGAQPAKYISGTIAPLRSAICAVSIQSQPANRRLPDHGAHAWNAAASSSVFHRDQ
jgi:hypothetical protein